MRDRRSVSSYCFLVLVVAAVGLVAGCGDDDNPAADDGDNDNGESLLRATPQKLITQYFKNAYDSRDSSLYAAMLDEAFKFTFREDDAEGLQLGPDFSWGKTDDLRSSGRMFGSNSVTDITLNIFISSDSAYTGDGCDDCRKLETTVTLRVATLVDNPDDPVLTLAVDSPQIFVVKPDPANPELWVLLRQIDVPRDAKTGAGAPAPSTESNSWGSVKYLFH